MTYPSLFCWVTATGVLVLVPRGLARHAKFLPFCWGTTVGQVTLARMWRWVQILASIERITVCMSRSDLGVRLDELDLVAVEPVEDADEPQALMNIAAASAATRATDPRRARAPRADVVPPGGMCMRAG